MSYLPVTTLTPPTEATVYQRKDIYFRFYLSQPDAGQFVLGTSKLNSTDVLGSNYTWVEYIDELAEIVLGRTTDVTSGIFMRATGNTAELLARSSTLDPYANAYVHPNAKIKIDWMDIGTGIWTNWLTGFINNIEVTYNQNAGTLVRLSCEDFMRRFRNTPIASYSHVAASTETIMADFVSTAFALSGLDDAVYTPYYRTATPDIVPSFYSNLGAVSYTNTTAGAILDDFMDAELGNVYWEGEVMKIIPRGQYATQYIAYTNDMDNFVGGYSMDYLISNIDASLTSAPGTVLSKNNTDVSNFYGYIPAIAQVNLASQDDLRQWMDSITQYSPQIRISNFSMPYFVPMNNKDVIKVVNNFLGETDSPIYQRFVSLNIYVDATSVSTQMSLWQPV